MPSITKNHWLNLDDWKRVQDSVPICCVDVIPIQRNSAGGIESIGMILRDTPHQGRRWCIVGGRLLRNESMTEAAGRQLRETLGDDIHFQIDPAAQPSYIAQYFTEDRGFGLIDPRQHAIALTFVVEVNGAARATGEAHEFRWFPVTHLPLPGQCGFGQDRVISACLARAVLPQ
jgi:ADP-ribose pyrophosphatase YjhB (NUDIX family)